MIALILIWLISYIILFCILKSYFQKQSSFDIDDIFCFLTLFLIGPIGLLVLGVVLFLHWLEYLEINIKNPFYKEKK